MISLTNVTKHFAGSDHPVTALSNVSLEIERGEFVAVVGASGSGKSTLLQIIGCLDVPSSGQYVLDGVTVSEMDDRTLSHLRNAKIGFVFQSFNLIARTTVAENVETPMLYGEAPIDRARVERVLQRVGIQHRARHFPNELSGGEQQRAAIARALVLAPELLIADEPTGNLDSVNGAQILGLLSELHRDGLTIVMVTHDPSVAARAQRVISLADGRIVAASARATLAEAR